MKGADRIQSRRAGAAALALYLFVIPFSKAAVEIFFPILLLLWILGWHRWPFSGEGLRQIPPVHRKGFFLVVLYTAVCAASVIFSSHLKLSLTGFIGKTLEYSMLFLIAADLVDQPQASRRALRALLAAGVLVVLYGLLQEWALYTIGHGSETLDPIRGKKLDFARMVGPYENPNDLATFLMVTGLISAAWLTERMRAGRTLLLRLALTLLLAGCLLWTQSRGALLGFFFGLCFLGAVARGRKAIHWGIAAAIVSITALFLRFSRRQLFDMLTFSDSGSRERAEMWTTAWRMILDRPIRGHGINTFMANYSRYAPNSAQNPAYAHNCFLQITAETGLLGLAAFLLFLAGVGYFAWQALGVPEQELSPEDQPARILLVGLAAAFLAFLVQSFLDTNLYALRQAVLFWTLAGMTLGISARLLRARGAPSSNASC